MTLFYCLKVYNYGRGCLKINKSTSFIGGPSLKFYIWACRYALYWNLVFVIYLIQYFSTAMSTRWLNFLFQLNINHETTLGHQCWIDLILSKLFFQRCFANVKTTSINVRWLNFHFQPNINVETTSMNVDDQRCFNVDSMSSCLLGFFEREKLKTKKLRQNGSNLLCFFKKGIYCTQATKFLKALNESCIE